MILTTKSKQEIQCLLLKCCMVHGSKRDTGTIFYLLQSFITMLKTATLRFWGHSALQMRSFP
jgi:hypothetical protein